MRKELSSHCARCGRVTLHAKPGISNILHLLLSVITVGLWIPVWVLLGFGSAATKPRCQVCGMKEGGRLPHTGLRPASEYEKRTASLKG